MSDLGHNAGMILQMVIGAFSWAICLGVLSRAVFQARWQTTTKFVGAGCAVNIVLMILIGFSLPVTDRTNRGKPVNTV